MAKSGDDVINIALDTIKIRKQALVFINSKRGAEKQAEDISKKTDLISAKLNDLSEKVLKALSHPTKQCERLSRCIKKGIAFHHAGLAQKQKTLIEDAFRDGTIKIICCTPTLAAGVDLPAFRSVMKDLKRFGNYGMDWIPVLEYHQMTGRAGRPGKETFGEAISITSDRDQADEIIERYVHGQPEEIYSKLAVEPVLRTAILSLVSSGFVKDKKDLLKFFSKTFYAHQFGDMQRIESILNNMIGLLSSFKFIESSTTDEFVSAAELEDNKLKATRLGRRVSELYLDPVSANRFTTSLTNAVKPKPIALIHMLCRTGEMRPLLRVKTKEWGIIENQLAEHTDELLEKEPNSYDDEYSYFISAFKTSLMLNDWIEEKDEEYLLETYDVRPGELRVKIDNADWLCYGCVELSKILNLRGVVPELNKLRLRLKNGVKEELLPLLRLKGVGRVRARKLFNNKIKDLGHVKKADLQKLANLIGRAVAISIKEQVGIKVKDKASVKDQAKGQQKIGDF